MSSEKTYKPRLQANNIDLSAILADINNLPPAGTEDISAELDAQTEAINSLMNMVNRKVAENNGAGDYVWKRAWKYTVNITQTTTGVNPTLFKVSGSGNNTDFTDVGFIVGLKFTSDLGHTLEFIDETSVRHINPSGTVSEYVFTWDADNATVQMPVQWSSKHTFTAQESMRTKEFIVGVGEFDYPDREYGDDGYWYAQYYEDYDKPENIREYIDIFGVIGAMSEGIDLSTIGGFTNMAIDYITLTSDTKIGNSFKHSLGKVPKLAIMFALSSVEKLGVILSYSILDGSNASVQTGHLNYLHANGYYLADSYSNITQTASAVRFGDTSITTSTRKYCKGVEYLLLTFA